MADQAVPAAGPEDAAVEEVEFTLDGRTVRARKGEMLIAAAERAGTFIRASATTRGWSRSASAGCASSR